SPPSDSRSRESRLRHSQARRKACRADRWNSNSYDSAAKPCQCIHHGRNCPRRRTDGRAIPGSPLAAMLTREQAIAEFDFERGLLLPDRLTTKSHSRYLEYAERMLDVYRRGAGRTRRDLHRAVAGVFVEEFDCPQKRIDAFCKLLDEASEFERDRRGQAAGLRREV